MAILIFFAACSNSSSSGDGSENEDIDYSLGSAPSEDLKVAETDDSGNKNFSAEENADGIYFECNVPENTWTSRVYIDGIGQVAEGIWFNEEKSRGAFFYPFLDAGKEYTIRIVFFREEDKDDEGFTINYTDDNDGVVGWFETKIKAGTKSKGEVRLTDSGKIEIKNNGDFKFTKRPKFEKEALLTGSDYDWTVDIGVCEGVSWLKKDRKNKWKWEVGIPQKELTQTHNFFISERYYGDFSKIDFICYRFSLYYKYGDKTYRYMWLGNTVETPEIKPEAELWTDIDVTKDSAKIQGTWTENDEWDVVSIDGYDIKCHEVYTETLSISGINVKVSSCRVYTKSSAFTKEDLLKCRWAYIGGSDGKEETGESNSSENWKLYDSCTLSDDGRTLTEKYENIECPLSEYFADYTSSSSSYTKHYDLKFFSDNLLRIIQSGKDEDGKDYEWYDDYKKQ